MHYLIIGGCAAGLNGIEGIRKVDKEGDITLISEEKYPPYARCLITNYLIGTHTEEDLLLRNKSYYEEMGVNLILGKKAGNLDTKNKKVVLSDGKEIFFDKLLIATGSLPQKLECSGEEKQGVFEFRNIQDVDNIKKTIEKCEKAFVFGGGLIGIKAAYGLKKIGVDVELIVKSSRLFSRFLNKSAADIISDCIQKNGIKITTGLAPVEVYGNKEMTGVKFDNGEEKKAQLGIIGKGVRANISSLNNTGLNLHWGVVADEYLKTNIDGIYAAGDVAETKDLITGEYYINPLWMNAQEQGYVAGMNMAGEMKLYPGSIAGNSAEFFGLPVISLGEVKKKEDVEIIEFNEEEKSIYKRFILKYNRLIGAVLLGEVEDAGVYLALIRAKVNLQDYKDSLGKSWFNYGKIKEFIETSDGFRESISPEGEKIFFR
ncbi:MAG: FAD-dependent oxidoreductase [Candidatus Omnitrophica bacterium]|nr:FAD-dependent oxidoreductase [Candidatus Omnitrophota bacterium]